jgi:acetylornithine deacetylase/succinyl-diaminopimelate desuccinylase-like protein
MNDNAADRLAVTVLERTVELAEIPAPTHAEAERAARVSAWWEHDGHGAVDVDAAGNVWARLRDGDGPALLVCAHLDTVFGADVDHRVRNEDGRMVGPSVGDDSIGVAALSAIAGLLDVSAEAMPIWVAATVGEEGLGNLCGIKHALADPPHAIAAVIAVEGNYLGRVSTVAVGSVRWRVEMHGPGGHAWEESSAPSAVHAAAGAVHQMVSMTIGRAGVSLNIGRMSGGEAINARARRAWFEVDLRADDPAVLQSLESECRGVLDSVAAVEVRIENLGNRPAGRMDAGHALVVAASDGLRSIGRDPRLVATSTDANAALDAGLPAVAVGITEGSGEHTPDEWIATAPVAEGLLALAATVNTYGRRA